MSYEYKEITSKDYGIKEKAYNDYTRTIRYKKLEGLPDIDPNTDESNWEFDLLISEEVIISEAEKTQQEIEDLKARITTLENK